MVDSAKLKKVFLYLTVKPPIHVIDDGEASITKVKHEEKFTSLLVGLSKKMLDKTEQGFIQMNETLKKESERKN